MSLFNAESETQLITTEALRDFLILLNPGSGTNQEETVDQLGQSSSLRFLLHTIHPDIEFPSPSKSRSNIQGLVVILSELDKALNAKYTKQFHNLQNDLITLKEDEVPMEIKQRIGELLLVASVESSLAAKIVGQIMSELTKETQLSIQEVIEKYGRLISDRSESSRIHGRGLVLESERNRQGEQPTDSKVSYQSSKPIVPELSLGVLQQQLTVRQERKDTTSGLKSPQLGRKEEATSWKEKYDSLKIEYAASETIREDLQSKLEHLRKDVEEQKQINERITKDMKQATSASQKSVGDVVDSLEREIVHLKQRCDELIKEKKEIEKSFSAQVATLRDENQLLSSDAGKVGKLEIAVEKWKAKAEELGALKMRNQELEKKVEDYMNRMIEVEADSKNSVEIRKALDLYKNKAVDLEAEIVALTSSNAELQARASQQATSLGEAEKRRLVSDLKVQAIVAEYEVKLHDAQQQLRGEGTGIDSDLNVKEKLMRLEKENKLLREGVSSDRVLELEFQLDGLKRLKDRLEKEYQAALAKLSLLEAGSATTTVSTDASFKLLHEKELALQQAKIETLEIQNKALQSQIDQDKARVGFHEDTIRARLEGQYEILVSTLKEQIQLRERELNFLRLAREEQLSSQRREERLMSSAFHELGVRYFQLIAEKEKIANEYGAVLLKMKRKRKSI